MIGVDLPLISPFDMHILRNRKQIYRAVHHRYAGISPWIRPIVGAITVHINRFTRAITVHTNLLTGIFFRTKCGREAITQSTESTIFLHTIEFNNRAQD